MGGQKIKQNPNSKLLGVVLDSKLNFQEQFKYIESKAQMTVPSLNKVAKKITHRNKLFADTIPQFSYTKAGMCSHSLADRKLWTSTKGSEAWTGIVFGAIKYFRGRRVRS